MGFDVRRFDIYRKIPKDLTQPTLTGAIVSIASCSFIVFLLLVELSSFLAAETKNEMFVDEAKPDDKLEVRVNVSLIRLSCDFLGLDIQDDLGRHEVGFSGNTKKIPINDGAGCRFEGVFLVNKVPGNFHMSTHSARIQPMSLDFGHEIHEIRFGENVTNVEGLGAFAALSDIDMTDKSADSSFDYYIKLVPTIYQDLDGSQRHTYQYTYANKHYSQHGHGHRVLPAVWFRYDISPITVKYTVIRRPFYHFITTICAIVGGAFTVAGIIDSMIFTASEVFRKAELGKLS
ncbi:endoplasmic reticulum-Golgi intermediate compartment protein 1-like [Oscarella lobularis]|uniref:endoplasmic reticulum-Golgi intermediate compartment protein 1-like n=1 Tax=Oscarella lobularis TaxID=121494 RepID=UPI00331311D4